MLGSLVAHARCARHDSKMGARGAKQARMCANKGLRAFWPCVRSSRVLSRLGIVGGALVTVQ